MFTIKVTDIKKAREMSKGFTHTVSLIDIGTKLFFRRSNHLILNFDDIDDDRVPGCPKLHHIQRILDFTKNLTNDDSLLVHCHAGICRSTAAAIGILVQHGVPPSTALQKIKAIRPLLWPNLLVCKLFDEALGRDDIEPIVKEYNFSEEGLKYE